VGVSGLVSFLSQCLLLCVSLYICVHVSACGGAAPHALRVLMRLHQHTMSFQMKMLATAHAAAAAHAIGVVSTYCGAHAVPPGSTADAMTEDVVSVQLPELAVRVQWACRHAGVRQRTCTLHAMTTWWHARMLARWLERHISRVFVAATRGGSCQPDRN
jgi:hypothetical protein